MSNSIRTFLIGIALLGLGAQVHAQATDVDCSGCVDTKDIHFQAVTTNKIDSQAVTTGKIAFRAVTKDKIKTNAVTTPKIRDGAVTMDKLSSEVVNGLSSGDVKFRGVFVEGRTEGMRQLLESVAVDTSECSRWLSFTEDLRGGNFTTVTLSGSEAGPFTCTDPVAANLIADALNSNVNSSTACDGHDWTTSDGDLPSESRFSLDGSPDICTTGNRLSPCVGNVNWGGLGGMTCSAPSQSIDLIFQR